MSVINGTDKNATIIVEKSKFERCEAKGGVGGAIWGELGTESPGNVFHLISVNIIECKSSSASNNIPEAVYLKVPNQNNEEFLFDTITLNYQYSISNTILFINIYNLLKVADGDFTRLPIFKQKFIGFCEKPNMTNFIIQDNERNKLHPLPLLICECEDRTPSAIEKYPCSYNNGGDDCLLNSDGTCQNECSDTEFIII
jgi:hypothetical protein